MGVIHVPLHLIDFCSDIISGIVTVGLRPSLPIKGVAMILGNDLAGDRVVGDPQVTEAPCLMTQKEPNAHLYLSCAVTRAMSKVAEEASRKNSQGVMPVSNQAVNDKLVTPSSSVQEPESVGQVGPGVEFPELSPHKLVIEQERDPEIMSLKRGALSEREAENVPVCYFVDNNNVLMRKWRPSNIPASHKWGVVYQIVVPPPYRKDILVLAHDTPLAGHLGGPLPKTRTGNQYLLTIMCASTRFQKPFLSIILRQRRL